MRATAWQAASGNVGVASWLGGGQLEGRYALLVRMQEWPPGWGVGSWRRGLHY
jgi:hypothetical protein